MKKYAIVPAWSGKGKGFLLMRFSKVKEIPYDPDCLCKISKVLLNNAQGYEVDKSGKRFRSASFRDWEKFIYVNKNDIAEFPDDESALLYVEVM